jgi:hypothetical protein
MAEGKKTLFLNFKCYDLINDEEDEAGNFYGTNRWSILEDLLVKNIQKLIKNIYIGVFTEGIVWII